MRHPHVPAQPALLHCHRPSSEQSLHSHLTGGIFSPSRQRTLWMFDRFLEFVAPLDRSLGIRNRLASSTCSSRHHHRGHSSASFHNSLHFFAEPCSNLFGETQRNHRRSTVLHRCLANRCARPVAPTSLSPISAAASSPP